VIAADNSVSQPCVCGSALTFRGALLQIDSDNSESLTARSDTDVDARARRRNTVDAR
jgi:hypothetical protein